MSNPLHAKFDRLSEGDAFTFFGHIGAPDIEPFVGMVAMGVSEEQGVAYLFEVTQIHGDKGPYETVYCGKQLWEGRR